MTAPTYAITGASGHLGRLVVAELLARDVAARDVVGVVHARADAAELTDGTVEVREADCARPPSLDAAFAGVERLLLVSSGEPEQRVAHHTNIIQAAQAAGVSRIVYTSILNADHTANPLAVEHRHIERALRTAGVPFTVLRNARYVEDFTDCLGQYLAASEILGAAGNGRITAASRQDYAAAPAAALLHDQEGSRRYELGGPAFDLPELARTINEVTGTTLTYRDLPVARCAGVLQRAGLDRGAARLVAPLDAASLAASSRPAAQTLRSCSGVQPHRSSKSSARHTRASRSDTRHPSAPDRRT